MLKLCSDCSCICFIQYHKCCCCQNIVCYKCVSQCDVCKLNTCKKCYNDNEKCDTCMTFYECYETDYIPVHSK